MNVTFIPVKEGVDQEKLADMAYEIWNEYWPSRIGQAQVDYMVANFQSLQAIKNDMAEHGYEYWFICVDDDVDASGADGNDAGGVGIERIAEGAIGGNAGSVSAHMRIVGYTGGHDEPETNRYFISKIYLFAHERGCGFASKTIRFYEDLCRERGLSAMYLTVNKHNDLGIRAYEGKGFETIDSVVTDIGEGFVMDDFIMEKRIGRH